jgi:hypothetical protein
MSVGPSRCGELDVVAELFEFDDELFDNAMQLVEIGMINENRPAPGRANMSATSMARTPSTRHRQRVAAQGLAWRLDLTINPLNGMGPTSLDEPVVAQGR